MITIINYREFEEFFYSYMEALMWVSEPDGDERGLGIVNISVTSRDILRSHAMSFFSQCHYYVEHETPEQTFSQLGHAFAFTQTRQGAGFWDGDWPKYGDMLAKLSQCYPEEIDYESLFL